MITKELKSIYLEALHEQIRDWAQKVKTLREEANVESSTGCTWFVTQLGQAMQQLTALENAAAELAAA